MIALWVSAAWAVCPVARTLGPDCRCWCDGPVFLPVPPDQDGVPEGEREGIYVEVFPSPGTIVPTNVQFRVQGVGSLHWFLNGETMPTAGEPHSSGPLAGVWLSRPDVPPNPGDQIELWTYETGIWSDEPMRLVATWTVGDGPDVVPPAWSGAYDVDTVDRKDDGCGFPEYSHTVLFDGASDDWPGGHLFASAVDLTEFSGDQLGDEAGFDVRWDGCVIEDLSLDSHFFKDYDVTLWDVAGNATGPFRVSTRPTTIGCRGCAGPSRKEVEALYPAPDHHVDSNGCNTGTAAAPWAVLPLALLRRRRS